MNHHPTMRVRTPDGNDADIDVLMVPLVKALWAAGYETVTCCQDLGESLHSYGCEREGAHWKGYALLEMFTEDACRFLDAVKDVPQFKDRMHWAAPAAWSIGILVLPFGHHGDARPSPWAQIRFPKDQVGDLTDVVRQSVDDGYPVEVWPTDKGPRNPRRGNWRSAPDCDRCKDTGRFREGNDAGGYTEAHCGCKRGRRMSELWYATKHGLSHPDEPEPEPGYDNDAPF
jgi:hypothetical protein